MNIFCLHQSFPGQFKNLLLKLPQDSRCNLVFLSEKEAKHPTNIRVIKYSIERRNIPTDEAATSVLARGGRRAIAVAETLARLKAEGCQPDLVLAHPGWGEQLYVRDVLGAVPIISWSEFYGSHESPILTFDPEFPIGYKLRACGSSQNAFMLSGLVDADAAIAATNWQKSQFPRQFSNKIHVIHEGIDTTLFRPDPTGQTWIELPDGQRLTADQEVITYAARGLEPLRGFHIMLRAAEIICDRRPQAHILILGDAFQTYVPPPLSYTSWLQFLKPKVQLEPTRIHFLGSLPYNKYRQVLQLSRAHVYLTYPSILSWSILEAMATGCALIGSATEPVLELLKDGWNGLLADFFSPIQIADQVDAILDEKVDVRKLRANARATVLEKFEMNHCVAQQIDLFNSFLNEKIIFKPEGGH